MPCTQNMMSLDDLQPGGNSFHADKKPKLLELPNEILLHALHIIPTLSLLQMRAVNHRFCSLIERIVHGRLLVAASLRDWKLIVECYHPSSQYSEPYVFCEYLGTPSLGNDAALQLSMSSSLTGELREGLKGLLARFRPTLKTPETRITRPYPPEDNCGQPRTELPSLARSSEEEAVKRRVNLDSHENFSQLMFNASLVRIGPRKGVFLALADVLERKTMRIFRDWLARKAHGTLRGVTPSLDVSPNERPRADNGDERASELIWVDEGSKIAGLEVEVRELRWRREMPILVSRDEDQAVSYSLELKELRISIIHLLLAMERKMLETDSDTGRAMIFGSFPIATEQGTQSAQHPQTM